MEHLGDMYAKYGPKHPQEGDDSLEAKPPIPLRPSTNGYHVGPPQPGSRPEVGAASSPEAARPGLREPTAGLERIPEGSGEPERARGEKQRAGRVVGPFQWRREKPPCAICRGAGYLRQDLPVNDPNFGKIVPCSCKEKELKDKHRAELKGLANLDFHNEQTFQTFDPSVPGTKEAFEVAKTYARDPNGWLVLSGVVGCGKTHLAAAIANVRLDAGSLVVFSAVPELLDYLRKAFAPSDELPYHDLFDRIQQAELLVLDDLGVERSTAWASEKLFQIINFRYLARIPTVITTNADPLRSDLKGLDVRVQSRLHDIGLVRWCHIKAEDYRPRNVPNKSVRPR